MLERDGKVENCHEAALVGSHGTTKRDNYLRHDLVPSHHDINTFSSSNYYACWCNHLCCLGFSAYEHGEHPLVPCGRKPQKEGDSDSWFTFRLPRTHTSGSCGVILNVFQYNTGFSIIPNREPWATSHTMDFGRYVGWKHIWEHHCKSMDHKAMHGKTLTWPNAQ